MDLAPVLELASQSTFSLEEYLAQPRYRERALVLSLSEVSDLLTPHGRLYYGGVDGGEG